MMELFLASRQWAERPADQRFWDIIEAEKECRGYMETARELPVHYRDLRTEAVDGEVRLVGRQDRPALLTHWSFGQLASRAGAPPAYLRTLPATLAVQNINHGLKGKAADVSAKMLLHENGSILCRAFTSDDYKRIWNAQIFSLLVPLLGDGWRTPPARLCRNANDPRSRLATESDVMTRGGASGLSVKVGDRIAPAGVYASDHDMFCYMVNEGHTVKTAQGDLATGFFVWNSEVGDKSFGVCRFLYNYTCGNRIVYGTQDVQEIRMSHVGHAPERAARHLRIELRQYADEPVSGLEAKIKTVQAYDLGATKEEALSAVLGIAAKKRIDLRAKQLDAAYDIAELHSDWYGSPRTLWGMANGLTELSQQTPHADTRAHIDRAAGRLLDAAF